MRLPHLRPTRRPTSRFLGSARLIRIRLWLAMLGLAVLPMVGVILLMGALRTEEPPSTAGLHAWETADAAADLTAAERALEARLLAVAADADLRKLVDGVSGTSERATATKVVSMLEMGDDGLIEGALHHAHAGWLASGHQRARRHLERYRRLRLLDARARRLWRPRRVASSRPPSAAATARAVSHRHRADGRCPPQLRRAQRRGQPARPVRGHARARPVSAPAPCSWTSPTSTIVAGARTDAVISGADIAGTRPLGNLRVRVDGIVSGHEGTADALGRRRLDRHRSAPVVLGRRCPLRSHPSLAARCPSPQPTCCSSRSSASPCWSCS